MKFFALVKKYWLIVFLVCLGLIPLIWFWGKGDVLITGLDTNFPLNPLAWFLRRFFVWNDTVNAGVDFSASTAGIFFHFIQLIPFLVGLPLKIVEIVSMVFWFSIIVFSSLIFARAIEPKNKIAQATTVTLYTLNIYLFNTWENVKVSNLSLVAALPIFVSIVYLWTALRISDKKAVLFLSLGAVIASGSGINPAYFSVIILAIVFEVLVLFLVNREKAQKFEILKKGFVSFVILILINFFWILPLSHDLIASRTQNLSDLGLTDWLRSLSENTSIINIARLQGAWDWYESDPYGMPLYLPYALNYLHKLPFILFSFCVPVLSLISFLFVKKERNFWYVFLGMLAVLGIFLGVGAHPPTGDLFIFLTNHVPFFSFFRSPWYIFTPILVLAYAGLTGLLLSYLFERLRDRRVNRLLGAITFLFLAAYGIYNYPLVTGKIFRPGRPDSFYVKFPDYVWQVKDWLGQDKKDSGRIISYPDDQLETFSWGYRGTESVLGLFSDREVITPSFNISSKPFSDILNTFYSHMRRKEYKSAFSLMNFLGAGEIFYKKDSPTLSPAIDSKIDTLTKKNVFGSWFFLKPDIQMAGKIFAANAVYQSFLTPKDLGKIAPILSVRDLIVNADDSEVAKIEGLPAGRQGKFPSLLNAEESGKENNAPDNIKNYKFELARAGKYKFEIEREFVDGIRLILDGEDIDSQRVSYSESFIDVGPVALNAREHHLTIIYPEAKNILKSSDYTSYAKNSGLRGDELPQRPRSTLTAFSSGVEQQNIKLEVGDFNPFLRYGISFDYKYAYGSVPLIDIIQFAPVSPVKTFPMYPGSSPDWERKSEVFDPVETGSKLEFTIKLPPNQFGGRSKSFFENISISRVYDSGVFLMEDEGSAISGLSHPDVSYKKISPVKYEVEINSGDTSSKGFVLAFLENYSSDWKLKSISGSGHKFPHFTINGYANGWFIPSGSGNKFIIYYLPQAYYLLAAGVSVATIGIISIGFLVKRKNDKATYT